jgi:hypothetical protein
MKRSTFFITVLNPSLNQGFAFTYKTRKMHTIMNGMMINLINLIDLYPETFPKNKNLGKIMKFFTDLNPSYHIDRTTKCNAAISGKNIKVINKKNEIMLKTIVKGLWYTTVNMDVSIVPDKTKFKSLFL